MGQPALDDGHTLGERGRELDLRGLGDPGAEHVLGLLDETTPQGFEGVAHLDLADVGLVQGRESVLACKAAAATASCLDSATAESRQACSIASRTTTSNCAGC